MSLFFQALNRETTAADTIPVPDGPVVMSIGRADGNDFLLNHTSISESHARLDTSDVNSVELIDCNSRNGTFVNGVRITRKDIQPGDVVKFAYLAYRLVESEDGVVAEPEVAARAEDNLVDSELLETLQREFAEKDARVSSLGGHLEEKDLQMAGLKSELEKDDSNLDQEHRVREGVEAINQSMQPELKSINDAQAETNRSLQEEQRTRGTTEAENQELQAEVAALTEQLKRSDQSLQESKEEVVLLHSRVDELATLRGKVCEEAASEKALREKKEAESAQRLRETESLTETQDKLRAQLQERDAAILERDKMIATLRFEADRQSRQLESTENRVLALEADCVQWQNTYENLKESLGETASQLQDSNNLATTTRATLDEFLARFRSFVGQLHRDWEFWKIEAALAGVENMDSVEACFAEAEALRIAIREELDEVEPIWEKFGKRVQLELEENVVTLQSEIKELSRESAEKSSEVASLTEDVRGLRERVDFEVRRAQGLSRSGVQIEMPERFESMVIAKGREKQILLSLVNQIEFLETITKGYRRSRKLREVVSDLEQFSKKIIAILEANGVAEFSLEPGTELTLKHRKEVQILGKKGWGTREYGERPFHPGIVREVIRSGYRAGQGEGSFLLRKVEVLIREMES